MSNIANTPEPPYYAVIFTSRRTAGDGLAYEAMAARMVELAVSQPGYLGHESVRGADGFGITVSYWRDEASIAAWKQNSEHLEAQRLGRDSWYEYFETRVAWVERAHGGRK